MEMADLFNQLKYGITEAEHYKMGKERESKILKQELFKSRMADVLSKNLLERNYQDNINKNYDELITNKNINTIDSNTNLEGTSNFIYINNNESNNNNNNSNPEKLNSNEKNNGLSSLAQAGKNVIELTGENEMIPIINNNIKNEDDKRY